MRVVPRVIVVGVCGRSVIFACRGAVSHGGDLRWSAVACYFSVEALLLASLSHDTALGCCAAHFALSHDSSLVLCCSL